MSRQSRITVWVSSCFALAAFGCGSTSGRDDLFASAGQVATVEGAATGGGSGESEPPDGAAAPSAAGGSSGGGADGAGSAGGGPDGEVASVGGASGGPPAGAGGLTGHGQPDGAGGAGGAGGADAGPPPCTRTRFYLDADGDGFGDVAHATDACAMPLHHVTNHTDCYDGNADAHPGQTTVFEVDRGDGSYDYDCDGSATLTDSTVGHCGTFPFCSGSPGWKGTAALCGQAATWLVTCTGLTTICGQTTETRYQTCR